MRGPNLKEDGEMQVKYLHAMDKRALAAAANGHEHDWPIRLRASAVSLHPGTVDAEVDPSRLMMFAVGDVPDGLLKTAIQHQSYGVLIHLSAQIKRETTSSCAAISKVLPESEKCGPPFGKTYQWEGRTFSVPGYSILWMQQGYSVRRLPECRRSRQQLEKSFRTKVTRIINNGAWTGRCAPFSVNSNIILEEYGTFTLPQHVDVGRLCMFLRYW